MQTLGWQSLEDRRRGARLAMMYKGVHGLVAVPHENRIENIRTEQELKSTYKLKVYVSKTETFQSSFFPKTMKDWNIKSRRGHCNCPFFG